MKVVVREQFIRRIDGHFRTGPAAFTLIEMLLVMGIIGYLIALLLPVLSAANEVARRTQCAANLRQIGYAFQSYANDNKGWIPRDCTLGRPDRQPWMIQMAKYLKGAGPDLTIDQLPGFRILQCPSHPATDIPSGYVVNAFAFETDPAWSPDGPIKITQLLKKNEMPWVLEAANDFPGDGPGGVPQIFLVQYHDVYAPDHLPRQERQRISDDRHYKRQANILYLDSHVSLIRRGELKLEMLDDGLRIHATPPPDTGKN